jgi:hypothetical protein
VGIEPTTFSLSHKVTSIAKIGKDWSCSDGFAEPDPHATQTGLQITESIERPIGNRSVQLASKTGHLWQVTQQPSRVRAIESARFMERAMGIEPTSEAWEVIGDSGFASLRRAVSLSKRAIERRGHAAISMQNGISGLHGASRAPGTIVSAQALKVPISHGGIFVVHRCKHDTRNVLC